MNKARGESTPARRRYARILAWGLALLTLVGGGLFIGYLPWVPFHPVCVPNHDERGIWGQMLLGNYMSLRGPLRDDFKQVANDRFHPRLVTHDGLYVTIDFYLDPNYYYNFTRRIVASLVHREFNPEHFDGYGRRLLDWGEKAKVDGVILIPRWNRQRECEFMRFFAIDGTPPPKNIRQAFEETRFDHSEESIDEGMLIMEHFIEKYQTD